MALLFAAPLTGVGFGGALCPQAWAQVRGAGALQDGVASVQLETLPTHSRLQLRLDSSLKTQWKSDAQGFELLIVGGTPADFGVVLGGEKEWETQVARLADDRLAELRVVEVEKGVALKGRWKYPAGDQAPAEPAMQHFDYWEKEKGFLLVDFWPKSGPTVAEARNARILAARRLAQEQAAKSATERKSRRIASEKNRKEAQDVAQFCQTAATETSEIFLPFGPARDEFPFQKYVTFVTPDTGYSYTRPEATKGKPLAADARYLKLALELYEKGKNALAIRTLEFMRAEVPGSPLAPEAAFLRVNALIKLGFQVDGERYLREVLSRYPSHPAAAQSALYLALSELKRESYLTALEKFLWLSRNHSENQNAWLYRMGAAEMLYKLKQTERAAKEYQWVAENAPQPKNRAEAAFRAGDLFLTRFQYERALASYFQAIEMFKKEGEQYPPVFLNRAESLYWLGQHDRAIGAFEKFVEQFGAHPAGWRATLRLGEIYLRREGEKNQAEARRWFYETVNRYPTSAGATIARLRLLPCGDHGGFDLPVALRFFEGEAAKYAGGDGVILDRYRDLRALARVRTLVSLERVDLAVDAAIEELRQGGTAEARRALSSLLRKLFRKTIVDLIATGKGYDAIVFYQTKNELIPGPRGSVEDPAVESDYLLSLSREASKHGLVTLSQELLAKYRRHAGGGRELASEQSLLEIGDTEARRRISERSFSEARARWESVRNQAKVSEEDERTLRASLAQVLDDTEYSYQKRLISALFEAKMGKPATALSQAMKAELLQDASERLAEKSEPRLKAWIAMLQAQAGDPRTALRALQALGVTSSKSNASKKGESDPKTKAAPEAEAHSTKASESQGEATEGAPSLARLLGVPPIPSESERALVEGEILAKLGRWGDAARAFARSAEQGGDAKAALSSDRARYEQARALRKTRRPADAKKAEELLLELSKSAKDEFWKRLAQDALSVASKETGVR